MSSIPRMGLAIAALLFTSLAPAHDGPDPQDSARAASSLGTVAFANSGAPAAQAEFLRGLASLHNFQYPDAAAAFREAQAADPGFAMAYWGEAMTYNHPIWWQQDLAAARMALKKLAPDAKARAERAATPREKEYLQAAEILFGEGEKYDRDRRFARAMEALHRHYPDDLDATCFYALALMGTASSGRDIPTYMKAAALVQEAFEAHPQHPGAVHYLIHSVDDPVHAPLGLRAARAYAKIAPDSPHALHMTSHIFLALGLWQDTVDANEAALRVADAKRRARNKDARAPGCGHGESWLSYAYLEQGRIEDARRMVTACFEDARDHARPGGEGKVEASLIESFHEVRTRYLIDTDEWNGPVAALAVDTRGVPAAEFSRAFVQAYGAFRGGDAVQLRKAVADAEAAGKRLSASIDREGLSPEHPQRGALAIQLDELRALLLLRSGRKDEAVALLSKAARSERVLPMEFGPPTVEKPANELLGEVLLGQGRRKEAREAFEAALVLAPGRVQATKGLAAAAAS